MTQSSLLKFRPVFTLEQIQYISELCSIQPYHTTTADPVLLYDGVMRHSIRKVLVPLIAKVEVGAINPAYKLSETHALKQAESAERNRYENNLMTPSEEAIYESKILGDLGNMDNMGNMESENL